MKLDVTGLVYPNRKYSEVLTNNSEVHSGIPNLGRVTNNRDINKKHQNRRDSLTSLKAVENGHITYLLTKRSPVIP